MLPALNQPVQLQEPAKASVTNMSKHAQVSSKKSARDHVDKASVAQTSIDSNEADQFIEQLMKEAETDPKLRELTYGHKAQQQQQQPSPQPPPAPLNESYPMVQRPYRTAQDLIIKERDDDSRSPTM